MPVILRRICDIDSGSDTRSPMGGIQGRDSTRRSKKYLVSVVLDLAIVLRYILHWTVTMKDKEKRSRSLNSYIFAGLGKVWMWWPERNAVKKRCKVIGKTGWYKCELCGTEVERLDVDHIQPVVPVSGFTTWDAYIAARFVTADKLQGICRECHKQKTKKENTQRKVIKDSSKVVCQHDDPSWCTDKCLKGRKNV